MMRFFFTTIIFLFYAMVSYGLSPDEILSDTALEARARNISLNLRCVVCQNEPIDTSNASIARDLRLLVRERLLQGDNDQQVYDYIVARYGNYVLFKPPWQRSTYLLWLAPVLILGFGLLLLVLNLRRRDSNRVQDLNRDEQEHLQRILRE